jgi:hypothetical protein
MNIDVERIRAFFIHDRFTANAGVVIDSVTEEEVRCSMSITAEHFNAGGEREEADRTLDLPALIDWTVFLFARFHVNGTREDIWNLVLKYSPIKNACRGTHGRRSGSWAVYLMSGTVSPFSL